MTKAYVIGSMLEVQEINRLCKALHTLNYEVRCVNPITTSCQEAVHECYKNIEWCDTFIVVTKSDGSISESMIHELCFAEYLDKRIYIIRSNE